MSERQEPLEERLRRVLDQAASQLPVAVPDPKVAASSAAGFGASRSWRRGVGGWASGLSAAITALAVVVAVAIAIGGIVLLRHRQPPGKAVTSGSNQGPGIAMAGSKPALSAKVRALRGRPIVLFAWASWCEPCRADFGVMSGVARRFAGRVTFLGVDVQDTRESAQSLLRREPLGFPSYRSDLDLRPIVPVALDGVPATVFINAQGQLASLHMGQYRFPAALVRDIDSYVLHSQP